MKKLGDNRSHTKTIFTTWNEKKSDLEIGDMEIMMEDLLYYHYVDSCLSSDYPVWAELFPFQVEPSLHLSRISVIRFFFSLFTVKSTFQYSFGTI